MIKYIQGNLLESKTQALVNTVNTLGVMGKGIALQFKKEFPNNYKAYKKVCEKGELKVGRLFVFEENTVFGTKIIVNFPTKTDWRRPSSYAYIESGLKELVHLIQEKKIKSIAIPPLGAGNGGLDWQKVKILLHQYLAELDCEIYIYEPSVQIPEIILQEKTKLTPARAMLLAVLYDLVQNGEFVTEFAAEKIAYFLQRFGAKEIFKLDYQPNYYGPYSGKVKHVLHHLNGSYLQGYAAKDAKPFQEISLLMDTQESVLAYLEQQGNPAFLDIVHRVQDFLSGFYASFSLELLSTIDFIVQEKKITVSKEIKQEIDSWSVRKSRLFSEKHIDIAKNHLLNYFPI
jgi:O-acetyl-ADP-ribose deacetylase (regulator of RNase III)/uncharacterized protein YwgA